MRIISLILLNSISDDLAPSDFDSFALLSGKHVVFGRVLEGADVVNKIQNIAVGGGARPTQPVIIKDCGLLA